MQDNMTITDISNEEAVNDALKYTCLECNFKTMDKSQMDVHVKSIHAGVEVEEVSFVCGSCDHKFSKEHDFNKHVKTHDKPDENVVLIEDLLEANETDDDLNIGTLHEKPEELPSNCVKIPENFKCTKCDFAFTSPVDLNSHGEVN